jgi:hypothetical protein
MSNHTYVKPTDLDVGLLTSEINAAVATSNVKVVSDEGPNIKITMDPDVAVGEQAAMDAAVSAHPLITMYRDKHIAQMSSEVMVFIYSKYDDETQKSLTALHAVALTNRKAHVKDAIDWLDDVLARFYSKKTSINAATTKTAVEAITWDWEAEFGDSGTQTADPGVTIENTLAITD